MPVPASPLVGRDRELAALFEASDTIAQSGRAVLISGDPGIGKTALAGAVASELGARGWTVLTCAGVEGEAGIPYAGLHLLLQPLLSAREGLAPPQHEALEVVFGLRQGEAPSPLLIGLATLSLLSDAAARAPVLLVADDVSALDAPTRTVLMFVARRVAHDQVMMIMTARSGEVPDAAGPELTRMALAPLAFIEADAVLGRRPVPVSTTERRYLLEAAHGNPLALMELPADAPRADGAIALTDRLVAAFAGACERLPRESRVATVAAALQERATVSEVLAATSAALARPVTIRVFDAALAARIVGVTGERPTFRHPLARHAVLHAASGEDWHAAARGLIETLEPRRTIGLRAQVAVAPDAGLADELEASARATERSGDLLAAAAAYRRAAELTAAPDARSRRMMVAAEVADAAGDYETAAALLDAIGVEGAPEDVRARAAWLHELVPSRGEVRLGGDIGSALAAIERMRRAGDVDRAMAAVQFLGTLAWGSSSDATSGERILAAAKAFGLPASDPRIVMISALVAPYELQGEVLPDLDAESIAALDVEEAAVYGYALTNVGRVDDGAPYMRRAIAVLRQRGDLQRLPHLLMTFGWNCYVRGALNEGMGAADEAASIALDTGDAIGLAAARDLRAFFAALDGEEPDVEWITNGSAAAAIALETPAMRTTLVFARGMAALARGDHARAVEHLARLVRPADDAYHVVFCMLALPDLVDAATRAGDTDAVAAALAHVRSPGFRAWQPSIAQDALRIATILSAPDHELDATHGELDSEGLGGVFARGKLELAIGERLRRARAVAPAREHLRRAVELLDGAGAVTWSRRARHELRAAGERVARSARSAGVEALTPQELRVCRLAAAGHSNREIAQVLFLSHRTVGAHLYAAFRKLDISARDQLPDALPG